MANFMRRSDINNLINNINWAIKYSRGVKAIKHNPHIDPGGSGPGLSYGCHRFGGQVKNIVPEHMRQLKYQGGDHINYRINPGEVATQGRMNQFINDLNSAVDQIRDNISGGDAPALNVSRVANVSRTIARLSQLQAAANAMQTVSNTLNRVNGWYNSNDRCNRSCQVNCQVGCQVACNSVNWCHDQKCGGH